MVPMKLAAFHPALRLSDLPSAMAALCLRYTISLQFKALKGGKAPLPADLVKLGYQVTLGKNGDALNLALSGVVNAKLLNQEDGVIAYTIVGFTTRTLGSESCFD